MHTPRTACPPLLLILLLSPLAWAAPPAADIRALIDDGKFPEALSKISSGLSATRPGQRYELYMLKGECHLQTRMSNMAADAFDKAAGEAQEMEPRAVAQAHIVLIKKAPGLSYKVRAGEQKGQAIDISKPGPRRQAFAALLFDELALNKAKIRAAECARALPPILDIINDIAVLVGMEIAGTGKAEVTQETLKAMLARAKDLMSDTLKEMDRTVARIEKEANTYREFTQEQIDRNFRVRRVTVWQKYGLSRGDPATLQQISATCDKIGPAVQILGQAARSQQKELEALVDQSLRIHKQITVILDEDYTRIYQQRPK